MHQAFTLSFLQVLAVLAYAHENDVEPFLEPALRLTAALLNDVGKRHYK
jgi:hypothetical protein